MDYIFLVDTLLMGKRGLGFGHELYEHILYAEYESGVCVRNDLNILGNS